MRFILALILFAGLSACQVTEVASRTDSNIQMLTGTSNPTNLPNGFFAGFGSSWYINIDNWGASGTGKSRYFEPRNSDLQALRNIGGRVVRLQVHFEGAVFWRECDWQREMGYNSRNNCYDAAFAAASREGWTRQVSELDGFAGNQVIEQFVSAARRLNANGMHVVLTPSGFHFGNGQNWLSSSSGGMPLVHRYLENDPKFSDFFMAWSNRLTAAMVAGGVNNFSFMSVNEPQYCNGGPSRRETRAWQSQERRIFDAVRLAAPGVHLISSATCGGGFDFFRAGFSEQGSKMDISVVMPDHDLENISYALHMRNPRLLLAPYDFQLLPGTSLSYPYQPLPASAGLDENTRREIALYNELKPSAQYYDMMFRAIADAGRQSGRRILVSEMSIATPATGLPRGDRIMLANDIYSAAGRYGIPVLWSGLFEKDGLSSNGREGGPPRSDFDPQLMAVFRAANR